jgi:hypothetical protein
MDNNTLAKQLTNGSSENLAISKYNRGCLFWSQSQLEDPENRLEYSIKEIDSALKDYESCSFEKYVKMNARCFAYLCLSEEKSGSEKEELLKNAIDSLENSEKFFKFDNSSLYWIQTLRLKGLASYYRSERNNKLELKNSIEYFKAAKEKLNKEIYPLYYAEICRNLGKAYNSMAIQTTSKEDRYNATGFLKESIDIWRTQNCSVEYAYAENELGKIYKELSKDDAGYLDLYNEAFDNAAKVFAKEGNKKMIKIIEDNRN